MDRRQIVVGTTFSSDFPTVNAAQGGIRYDPDAFVSRVNHAGTILEFSTFLGGGNGYPGDPTDVSVTEVGGLAGFNPFVYLVALGVLVLLALGVWFGYGRRKSSGE